MTLPGIDRRNFFKMLGIGVGGIALEQAIPLGRVWSFPKEIMIPFSKVLVYSLDAGATWHEFSPAYPELLQIGGISYAVDARVFHNRAFNVDAFRMHYPAAMAPDKTER